MTVAGSASISIGLVMAAMDWSRMRGCEPSHAKSGDQARLNRGMALRGPGSPWMPRLKAVSSASAREA